MSIIYEALKKAQSQAGRPSDVKEESPPLQETTAPTPSEPVLTKNPALTSPTKNPLQKILASISPKEKTTLAMTLAVCLVLLTAMILIFNHISTSREYAKAKKGGFVVTGVMEKSNKTVALINNKVYEVGDTIRGMKIIKITLDRIDLIHHGRVRSFRIERK